MKLIPQLKKVKANTCISNLPSFLSFKIIKLIWTQTLYLVRLHFNWNRLSKNFPYNSNSPWIFQISSTLGSNDISKVWANTQIPFVPGIREQYFRVCVVGGGRVTETERNRDRQQIKTEKTGIHKTVLIPTAVGNLFHLHCYPEVRSGKT